MRFIILALLIGFSSIADAQFFSEDTRDRARDDVEEARDCLDSMDRDELNDLAEEAEDMADEVRDLCRDGDDIAAKDMVSAYIEKMDNHRDFDELAECSDILRDAMPNMEIAELPDLREYEDELDDICDYLD